MNLINLSITSMNSSQKAINSACRILGIREHSEKQIRTKLIKKGFESKDVAQAIKFLYQESWLSNERFCGSFIRSRVSKGQGKIRIEFELIQNEVAQNLINEAFENENIDWQIECEKVLGKKISSIHSTNIFSVIGESTNDKNIENNELDFKDKLKIERFMKYRGFETSQVRKAFSKIRLQ